MSLRKPWGRQDGVDRRDEIGQVVTNGSDVDVLTQFVSQGGGHGRRLPVVGQDHPQSVLGEGPRRGHVRDAEAEEKE